MAKWRSWSSGCELLVESTSTSSGGSENSQERSFGYKTINRDVRFSAAPNDNYVSVQRLRTLLFHRLERSPGAVQL